MNRLVALMCASSLVGTAVPPPATGGTAGLAGPASSCEPGDYLVAMGALVTGSPWRERAPCVSCGS